MSGGPSPVIPLLVVAAISVLLCWEDLINGYEFILEIQDTTIVLFIVIPVFILFLAQSMTELIIIPLAFLLVVFLLRTELIVPLIVLILIHFLAKFCYSSENKSSPSYWEQETGPNGGGNGLEWFLFVVLCLVLYPWFYESEGYGWICLVFGLICTLYFNMV